MAADGGGFADFRKQQQARLLAAIDSTLAAKAENAITENFAAVKRAGVHLQSGLGGRKSGGAVNVIGAFAESDSRAFGWQLRAYAAEGGDKGGNVGLFYRQTGGGILYGANAFLDYEDGDYGAFSRYGFGGELSHSVFALAANYYIPQTDDRKINATVAAFSREGYDAKLRLNAPGYREVKAAFDYYHFDGKGETAKDAGWRYGLEFVPIPSFHFALYYDDSAETIGGDIGYSHTIGETQKRESNAAFAPDLFAAVSREYSQRIATVATTTTAPILTTPPPPPDNVSIDIMTMRTTTAITAAAITTTARMTTAAVTTTMTTEMPGMTVASRVASVEVTVQTEVGLVITTFRNSRVLVTLPPENTQRPHVLTITTSRNSPVFDGRVIITPRPLLLPVGDFYQFPQPSPPNRVYTITLVQGGEEIVGEPTTTTLTNRTTTTMAEVITETPMTMAAVSTTTRITTFSTMFITLTANSAMGGNDEKGGNDKQPSFPRKRESKPLSFVHLRESANGDLSPQMANRRVRKARS